MYSIYPNNYFEKYFLDEVLQTKWNGLKDCYKKYRKAEKLTGDKSGHCTTYHRWCWAEPLQFLESCQWNRSPRYKISETSVLVSSVESVLLPASPQIVSTTSVPTQCVDPEEVQQAMQEDPKPRPKPPTFTQATSPGQSACFLEPSCKRKWKRSYSTSADEGDTGRTLFKHAKLVRTPGAIDLLFKSYIETFKTLSSKKQASLKIKLAKLFAGAEMDELEVRADSATSEEAE